MKSIFFIYVFFLFGCHVHYHIQPKEVGVKKDFRFYPIGERTSIFPDNGGCGVIGCAVYHGAILTPTIFIDTLQYNLKVNK